MQKFIESYNDLKSIIEKNKNILVVCDSFLLNSFIFEILKKMNINIFTFTEFKPNPKYEEVLEGIKVFKENNCDLIIGIGGGSAIDVAKTIKAFVTLDNDNNYLKQQIKENNIPLVAIPTTAGTGSESTHFAVIYFDGKKYSIDDNSILPKYVLLEPKFLESLPLYQKKSTLLDALCQGIESYWSVNSTDESKNYARRAIKIILDNYIKYINENKEVYPKIMEASNYSGRAINISKTTAAHAMSYKITSLYGISHGHAVATCLPHIWEYMINNMDKVMDSRGTKYLDEIFSDLDFIFGCENHKDTLIKLNKILEDINLQHTNIVDEKDISELVSSVNENRLKNNPVFLDTKAIEKIYKKLL